MMTLIYWGPTIDCVLHLINQVMVILTGLILKVICLRIWDLFTAVLTSVPSLIFSVILVSVALPGDSSRGIESWLPFQPLLFLFWSWILALFCPRPAVTDFLMPLAAFCVIIPLLLLCPMHLDPLPSTTWCHTLLCGLLFPLYLDLFTSTSLSSYEVKPQLLQPSPSIQGLKAHYE